MKDLSRRRLVFSLPFVAALGAGAGFYSILAKLQTGRFDPKEIKTPQAKLPHFNLEKVQPFPTFDREELLKQTHPVVINFFASWCVACLAEMTILNELSSKMKIWGVAYKDNSNAINKFLSRNNNPYDRVARDEDGDAGIQWGLTGVPESFLVIPGGSIAWHVSKPLGEYDMEKILHNTRNVS